MGMHWREATSTTLKKLVSGERVGLVTDMDGTISHIVEKPEDAVVTPKNYELLRRLQEKLPLVSIVSGRSVRSVTARMALKGVVYIGNHGLERCVDGQVKHNFDVFAYRPALEAAVEELQKIQHEGVQVEDKGVTVTLHYRQTDDPQFAQGTLLPMVQEIADERELEFFEGRMIFELRPPVKANKGSAFRELVSEFSIESAIYIGDDTTDIAALKMAQQLRKSEMCYAIGVGVISDDSPAEIAAESDLLAMGVTDVENFLAWLIQNTK